MHFHKIINICTKDHRPCCRLRRIGLYGFILLLCLNMAMPAYAAEGSTNIADAGKLVSVDISWGEMQFTYTEAYELWNPSSHAYNSTVPAGWTAEGNWITVQNGEAAGTVKATLSSTSNVSSVQGLFKADGSTDAGSKEYEMTLTKNQSQKLWFNLNGSITTSYEVLGEILITIIAQ